MRDFNQISYTEYQEIFAMMEEIFRSLITMNKEQPLEFYNTLAMIILDKIFYGYTRPIPDETSILKKYITKKQIHVFKKHAIENLSYYNQKFLQGKIFWNTEGSLNGFLHALGFQIMATDSFTEEDFPIPRYSSPEKFHLCGHNFLDNDDYLETIEKNL